MLKRSLTILTIIALLAVQSSGIAFAATTSPTNSINAGQALEIAPPVVTLTVNPGQTVSIPIYLRDISKTNLVVTGQADDFLAAGEDGTPKLLLDSEGTNPFSLKNWVTSLPGLTLIPREIKAMNVTVHVPKDASPGGHYGVIRFTATPPNLDTTGVSLSASLGALLLLTVSGKITESVSIEQFATSQNGQIGWLFEAPPIDLVERFRNSGNVHEQPTGRITIKDMLGRKLADVNVNIPPANVLPNSIRRYEQSLGNAIIGDKVMFGRYTADLTVTYGASKTMLTNHLDFWVIPYRLIIVLIIALVAAFFILRFAIKRYNRFIIGQSQRSRRH